MQSAWDKTRDHDIKKYIIFENEDFIIINKPAGIATHPILKNEAGTLIQKLLALRPEIKNVGPDPMRPGVVHRLDKDTSGLIAVAKTNEAHQWLIKQFKEKVIGKRYTTLVHGTVKENTGIIQTLIGRDPTDKKKQKTYSPVDPEAERRNLREAITEYKVLQRFKEYTLIEASPKTGRRHQIRVHMAHIGHPIVSDKLYGFKGLKIPGGLARQFLHASFLKFTGPDGKSYEFKSELPEELRQVIDNLKSEIKKVKNDLENFTF